MNHVARIVAKFGGAAALAASLTNDGNRLTTRAVVFNWIKRGRIPAHRQADILRAATARRIRVQPGELVEKPE